MELGFNFLYHLRATPVSIEEKALHMAAPITPHNSICNLKVSRCLVGSPYPPCTFTWGNLNFVDNGASNMSLMNVVPPPPSEVLQDMLINIRVL